MAISVPCFQIKPEKDTCILWAFPKGFHPIFQNVTYLLIKQPEDSARELDRPVVYFPSAKDRKENIAKDCLLSSPVDEGLICVIKTLESCRTAKVVGREGKNFLKSSQAKCLHFYLYYLDKEFGFMFVKIQTWFPFNIEYSSRSEPTFRLGVNQHTSWH